ncbi:hypothetical protein T492DRAFT_835411 [Pavlovales sp. CCMP2436]|nr:hypothetical protein T492DRAFT_835411 [Pavlovales sp. CCMP2436]
MYYTARPTHVQGGARRAGGDWAALRKGIAAAYAKDAQAHEAALAAIKLAIAQIEAAEAAEVVAAVEWEVHSVLDMQGEQENKQYLVQWAPLGRYNPSWEPEQNCQNCQVRITAFIARRVAA